MNLSPCCRACNTSKTKLSLESWRETLARRMDESPYFPPRHIAYLLRSGFDFNAHVFELAKNIKFHFEGGDGEIIAELVQKKSLKGY